MRSSKLDRSRPTRNLSPHQQSIRQRRHPQATHDSSRRSRSGNPNERFYIVSKNFNDPRVSADKWSLEVLGLVAQPRRFSYEEILALPTPSQYATLECISNTLGGNLMSNAHWTGVPLSELAHALGVQPEARAITFRSADNYY